MKDQVQAGFLQKIEESIPSHSSLVNELSELLEISTDSAYRRIRGETKLNIEEIAFLCEKYSISFDAFLKTNLSTVSFQYRQMNDGLSSFREHLQDLKKNLTQIHQAKERHVYYGCEDIPIFHNLSDDRISAFKIYYWMRSIMNIPSFQQEKFSFDLIPADILALGRELYELYSKIPSSEIWTDTTLQSTIKQIHYYWESGMFRSKEEALGTCESLRDIIIRIQKQAAAKSKVLNEDGTAGIEGNYFLYISDLEITNNSVVVKIGDFTSVFLGHLTFRTMSTNNGLYCSETEAWMNNLQSKATLISGVSEKLRNQFFIKALNLIDQLVSAIEED